MANDTVLTDHLGSAQVTAAEGGAASGVQQTTAFGEVRSRGGEMPTVYQYTGQLSQMEEVGLYHYGARWFDPAGAHFTQADTLIPELYNPLDVDRYAYGRGNPLKYTDPTGHMVDDGGDDGAWWDEYTPVYILENVHDDIEQHKMLVSYMYQHPDYNLLEDTQFEILGYDPVAMHASLSIYRFLAEAKRLNLQKISFSEFWENYGTPVVAAGIVLGSGLELPQVSIPDHQFGQKMAQHGLDFGLDPRYPEDRQKFRNLITDTATNAVEIRQGAWRGSQAQHYFYRKGDLVVVVTQNGEFVTILDQGSNNKWYLSATVLK